MKKILMILTAVLVISGCAKNEPLKVACMGASNTSGWNIPDLENNSYPGQLRQLAGEGWIVENFGVGGSTIMKSGDLPYWQTLGYREAQYFEPDIVIFDFGWNDLMKPQNRIYMEEDFVNDYNELIGIMENLPSKPKMYILLPPLYHSDEVEEGYLYMSQFYDEIIKQNDITPIDIYTPMTHVREYFIEDMAHYSIEGCAFVADTVFQKLQEDL